MTVALDGGDDGSVAGVANGATEASWVLNDGRNDGAGVGNLLRVDGYLDGERVGLGTISVVGLGDEEPSLKIVGATDTVGSTETGDAKAVGDTDGDKVGELVGIIKRNSGMSTIVVPEND